MFKKKKKEQQKRLDIILSLLYCFKDLGKNEVSLLEINNSILDIQKSYSLGYDYLDRIIYSSLLSEDFKSLNNMMMINQYRYKYDGYLPKSYISLTSYGIGNAKDKFKAMPKELYILIEQAVKDSIKKHDDTWKFFARPVNRDSLNLDLVESSKN